jgi:hypothetical protein
MEWNGRRGRSIDPAAIPYTSWLITIFVNMIAEPARNSTTSNSKINSHIQHAGLADTSEIFQYNRVYTTKNMNKLS